MVYQDWIDYLSFSVLHFFEQAGDALRDVERVDDTGPLVQRDQHSDHLKINKIVNFWSNINYNRNFRAKMKWMIIVCTFYEFHSKPILTKDIPNI